MKNSLTDSTIAIPKTGSTLTLGKKTLQLNRPAVASTSAQQPEAEPQTNPTETQATEGGQSSAAITVMMKRRSRMQPVATEAIIAPAKAFTAEDIEAMSSMPFDSSVEAIAEPLIKPEIKTEIRADLRAELQTLSGADIAKPRAAVIRKTAPKMAKKLLLSDQQSAKPAPTTIKREARIGSGKFAPTAPVTTLKPMAPAMPIRANAIPSATTPVMATRTISGAATGVITSPLSAPVSPVVSANALLSKELSTPTHIAAKNDTSNQSINNITDIDTSGYLLQGNKEPAKRGRKPSEFQFENDEIQALNAAESAELKRAARAKSKKPGSSVTNEEQLEQYRKQLTKLISLGKDRSYLTHAEINDHLPEELVDQETIQDVISTLNDMGIAVYDRAPDAAMMLLTDNVATAVSDDEAESVAAAALATVDSDFGRTTDPVRMYM